MIPEAVQQMFAGMGATPPPPKSPEEVKVYDLKRTIEKMQAEEVRLVDERDLALAQLDDLLRRIRKLEREMAGFLRRMREG